MNSKHSGADEYPPKKQQKRIDFPASLRVPQKMLELSIFEDCLSSSGSNTDSGVGLGELTKMIFINSALSREFEKV